MPLDDVVKLLPIGCHSSVGGLEEFKALMIKCRAITVWTDCHRGAILRALHGQLARDSLPALVKNCGAVKT